MSTYFYDDAIVKKLQLWTRNTEVTITGPDETRRLFEVIADKTNDSPIKLPLICLTRRGGYQVTAPSKKPLSFDGLTLEANLKKSQQLNAVPITINYQLDVYARYFKEADEYARNLVFNIINYPTFQVEIPYENIDIEHDANIRLVSEVEDNSGIPERLISGQFTRITLGLEVDDAYLWDVRTRDNYSIGFRMSVENEPVTDYNINPKTDFFPDSDEETDGKSYENKF